MVDGVTGTAGALVPCRVVPSASDSDLARVQTPLLKMAARHVPGPDRIERATLVCQKSTALPVCNQILTR